MALELVETMDQTAVNINCISYSAVISACAKGGHWQIALSLLQLVKDADETTYCAAISACEKCAEWERALQVLGALPQSQICVSNFAYSLAISACGKGNAWQHVLEVISDMGYVA